MSGTRTSSDLQKPLSASKPNDVVKNVSKVFKSFNHVIWNLVKNYIKKFPMARGPNPAPSHYQLNTQPLNHRTDEINGRPRQ
uniref:Uncharacterized protein n=1 Tax=Caenorhabditis japonica TaxID=281687 RepID=A0A8R1E819_CAEJA